ncbi:TPA: hypothetical protein ACGIK9_003445 [Acinetobacter baumannii]|uniref:hypothetical protein n=1 Tax=Acinetobacter baumannii TaxID=470 RepID=UPI00338DA424
MKILNLKYAISVASLSLIASISFASPSEGLKNQMKKMGTVAQVQTIDGGLTAWTLVTGSGKSAVFYTTPDEKVLIKGNLWRTSDKKNISDDLNLTALNYASPEFKQRVLANTGRGTTSTTNTSSTSQDGIAEIVGKYNGKVPEVIKILDQSAGYKEGKATAIDTLYVYYDPRCRWCHEAFYKTRPYIQKGFSIKWIPTLALGQSENAYNFAAAVFQNPQQDTLSRTFDRDQSAAVNATEQSKKLIDKNLENLLGLVANFTGQGGRVSVPTGFYLNKKTGKLKMVNAVGEDVNLDMVFGKLR